MKGYLAVTFLTRNDSGDTGPRKRLYYLKERVAAPEGVGGEREGERAAGQRDRDKEKERAAERQRHREGSSVVPFIVADLLGLLPWGRVGMFRDKVG